MRNKAIEFSFDLPINSLKKGEKNIWASVQTGSLTIFGKGIFKEGPASELPFDFQTPEERTWIDVHISVVDYKGMDIAPVLAGFKECSAMALLIRKTAFDHCIKIYKEKYGI